MKLNKPSFPFMLNLYHDSQQLKITKYFQPIIFLPYFYTSHLYTPLETVTPGPPLHSFTPPWKLSHLVYHFHSFTLPWKLSHLIHHFTPLHPHWKLSHRTPTSTPLHPLGNCHTWPHISLLYTPLETVTPQHFHSFTPPWKQPHLVPHFHSFRSLGNYNTWSPTSTPLDPLETITLGPPLPLL